MGKLKYLKQNLEIYNRLEDKYMVILEKECKNTQDLERLTILHTPSVNLKMPT